MKDINNINDNIIYDVIIIGAGPVGLFAAFQAGVFGLKCAIIDACDKVGGQCTHLYPDKSIYDIPAFTKIKATDLISNLKAQADIFNTTYYLSQTVTDIRKNNITETTINMNIDTDKTTKNCKYIYSILTNNNKTLYTRSVILSIGGGAFNAKKISIPNVNLKEFEEHSLLYSVKNKEIFRNKNIGIVGGGDAAVDWAITLAKFSANVYFIHRRNKLRCLPANQSLLEKLINEGYVKPMIPYKISNIYGTNKQIELVSLLSFNQEALQKNIEVDYLLAFLGLETDFTFMQNWGIHVEKDMIPVQQHSCETNLEMIYAIGDVSYYQGKMKLILTGFSEAATACNNIFLRLNSRASFNFQHSTSKSHIFEA